MKTKKIKIGNKYYTRAQAKKELKQLKCHIKMINKVLRR